MRYKAVLSSAALHASDPSRAGHGSMFSKHARAGVAVLIGLISLSCPLIGVNAIASPLLQATPTSVTRTPTAQNTPVKSTPEPSPSSDAVSPGADKYYEVKPGDTLWSIAANVYGNGGLYLLIQQANGLPEKSVLRVRSKLIIPSIDPPAPTSAPSSQATENLKPTAAPSPSSTATEAPILTARTAELLTADSEVMAPGTTNTGKGQPAPSFFGLTQSTAYLLSMLCFVGSFYCAYMSLEVYQRNQLYVRRRTIGDRVRAGL